MDTPYWNDERYQQLAELWVQPDLSATAIATRMGTTKGSVLGMAHRRGLAAQHPKRRSYSPKPTPAPTFPVAGSEAPVSQPPKDPEASEWRGAPVPTDLDDATVLKIQSAAERLPKDGVLLLKLKPHHCRWPVNDGNPWRFCGAPRANDKTSWCEEHAKRAISNWPPK